MGAMDGVGGLLLSKSGDDANITMDSPKMSMQLAKVKPGQNGKHGCYVVL